MNNLKRFVEWTKDDGMWLALPVFCIIICIPFIFLLKPTHCYENYAYSAHKTVSLYSGYNDTQLSGNWTILGGNINQTDVVYYWIDNQGVLSKHHVEMDQSTFIEDGGNYLVVYKAVCNDKKLRSGHLPSKYEFHVPEGSVARMYEFQ